MALTRPGGGTNDLGQERLGCGIAVQDVVFAALFVIDYELHGNFRTIGPFRIGRIRTITAHVTGITCHQRYLQISIMF